MLGGAIPVVSDLFQLLLNALGWVLATIYRFIPNYGNAWLYIYSWQNNGEFMSPGRKCM